MTFNYEVGETFKDFIDGDYQAVIEKCEEKQGNDGKYICIQWRIMKPDTYKGRIYFENFSIEHHNEKARDFALKNLNKICQDILGKPKGTIITDADFIGAEALIRIKNYSHEQEGMMRMRNKIVAHLPINGGNDIPFKDDIEF